MGGEDFGMRELADEVAKVLQADEELAGAPGFEAMAEDEGDVTAEVQRFLGGMGVLAVVAADGFDRREKSGRHLVGTARLRVDAIENVQLNRADGNGGWWSAWRTAERIARILHWRDFGRESPLRLVRMARNDTEGVQRVAMEFAIET